MRARARALLMALLFALLWLLILFRRSIFLGTLKSPSPFYFRVACSSSSAKRRTLTETGPRAGVCGVLFCPSFLGNNNLDRLRPVCRSDARSFVFIISDARASIRSCAAMSTFTRVIFHLCLEVVGGGISVKFWHYSWLRRIVFTHGL